MYRRPVGMTGLSCIKVNFSEKNPIVIEIKKIEFYINFPGLMIKLDFSLKYNFAVLYVKVNEWLPNHIVCKIGLKSSNG